MAPVPELRDHSSDHPVPEEPQRSPDRDRHADDRHAIRAAMDRAVRDPAFALSPEQESELRRAWSLSPNDAANYHPGYRTSLDRPLPDGRTPRDAMRDMPGITYKEATRYLITNADARPWLGPARHASMDARRVIATVDQGEGHHLQRHEGAASGEAARARVERLHDPANPDTASRERADDAFERTGGEPRRHVCGPEATAIADPDAYATAVARAYEHPEIRPVLDRGYDPDDYPGMIRVPIADLLGPRGHQACEGYRLQAVDGSTHKAMQNRAEWVKAGRDDTSSNAVEPRSEQIDSFDGGDVVFVFQPNRERTGYTIKTMYPVPPDRTA